MARVEARQLRLLASLALGCTTAMAQPVPATGAATPTPASTPAATPACGADLPARGRVLLELPAYQVALSPQSWPIPVGRHFALDVVVCPKADAAQPSAVRVDADMPAHRHGMNYRTAVRSTAAGRHTASGLMFHMPGQWRFIIDLQTPGGPQRVTHTLEVQ